MQDVKGDSAKRINKNRFIKARFSWQEGYGGFSYSKSQMNKVVVYINNQEKHHKKMTFSEEYNDFLKLFDIEFDERFVFKPIEYTTE